MASCSVFICNTDVLKGSLGTEAAVAILQLRRQLESFGKVLQVSELEGELGGMMVTYEDAKDAAKASEAFTSCDLQNLAQDENAARDHAIYDSDKAFDLLHVPTSATIAAVEDGTSSSDALSETSESTGSELDSSAAQGAVSSKSKPFFLKGLELNHICWDRFASRQEWRTSLQLRGIPKRLCDKTALEAFLAEHGLMYDVVKVKICANHGPRVGSAVLHASSVDGVERVARFFHGRVVSGASMPVSVSFASQQAKGRASSKPVKLREPSRISTDGFDFVTSLAADSFLLAPRPPPGLEHFAKSATLGCLPAWNPQWN